MASKHLCTVLSKYILSLNGYLAILNKRSWSLSCTQLAAIHLIASQLLQYNPKLSVYAACADKFDSNMAGCQQIQ